MTGLIVLNTLLIAFTDAELPVGHLPARWLGDRPDDPLHLRLSASRRLRSASANANVEAYAERPERTRLGHVDRTLGEMHSRPT